MKNKLSLFILMLISAISAKSATLSETIDGFFKPIVDNYLVPVIFWDPIKAMGFDVGADVPIVVVWLVFGAVYFTLKMNFINFRGFKHAIGLKKLSIVSLNVAAFADTAEISIRIKSDNFFIVNLLFLIADQL